MQKISLFPQTAGDTSWYTNPMEPLCTSSVNMKEIE